jgi:chromate transporter
MSEIAAAPPPAIQAPTLAELFFSFAKISLSGFGGVLPWARRVMVEEKRWMSAEEFNERFSLAQFLPGPNIVNFCVVFGSRFHGVPGAVVTLTGLMGPPVAIVIVIGMLYSHYGEIAALQRMLAGISAAAAGLIVATMAKMATPLFRKPLSFPPLIVLAAFVSVGLLRWPLPWVLLVLAPLSVGLTWGTRR